MRRTSPRGHAPLSRPVAAAAVLAAAITLLAPTAAAAPVSTASSVGAMSATSMVPSPASTVGLPGGTTVLGPAPGGAPLTVDVALRPRDPAALDAFVASVSTPGSPAFHHYLPARRFGSAFGPLPATLAATRAWLASTGLVVGPTTTDGLMIPVSGTTAQIEAAFAVPLVRGRLVSGRVARLAERAPLVPAPLAPALEGIVGLSDLSLSSPHLVHGAAVVGSPTGAGTSPSARTPAVAGPVPCPAIANVGNIWTADKLATTYGLGTLYGQGRTGAGQTIGVYELEPYTPSDVQTYEACYGLGVPVTNVNVDGGSPGPQFGEAALDVELSAAMAPGGSVRVYTGPNGNGPGPIDTLARMVTDDAAEVLSISWGQCEAMMSPSDSAQEATLFAEAAAQGQTVVAASGDAGSSDCWSPVSNPTGTQLAVDDPAVQPDVTGVGGTSLTAAAPNAPTETVWNTPFSNLTGNGGAGGGGNSSTIVAPGWQQVPAARSADTSLACGASHNQQCREVPDVAASSDPARGVPIFVDGQWSSFGGTSAAAPVWAASVAVVDQGCASPAGLLNPALYGAAGGPAVNDVTTGTNSLFQGSHFTARAGYDLASGWGSPQAAGLLGLLTGSSSGCPTVTGLSPAAGPATGGTTVTIAGSGFGTGTPTVHFGAATALVVGSTPTSVTVITPNVTYGSVAGVTVTTTGVAAGTSPVQAASAFTFLSPRVTSVVVNHGPPGGGGSVTVNGSGFGAGDTVSFGATPATGVVADSSTRLTVTVPPGAPSTAAMVSVRDVTGTSPPTPAATYYYVLPGYLMVAADGGVFAYGAAAFHGSTGGQPLAAPMVSSTMTPSGQGYWMVGSNGQVFPFGTAANYGSAAQIRLNHPIVGMAATPDGGGYWLVASDGGVFAYGDAGFFGSAGNLVLNRPIVGMAATPDGGGYWLVASDGGVFAYGDAGFVGSAGNLVLNRPIVGMAATPDGGGYWLVASDGGVFAYGDAGFVGSAGNLVLNRPIVGMSVDQSGDGYWLVASDGGIFAYGSAPFYGSTGNLVLNEPIVAMGAT